MNAVYRIVCIANGKFYIGSTTRVRKRWTDHKHRLRNSVHPNPHLQSAWNKYGEGQFKFEVIETASTQEDMLRLEQEYIDRHAKQPYFFNAALYVRAPMKGRTFSEAAIAKFKKFRHTEEAKRKIGEASKGRLHTPESKRKLSAAHKGKVIPQEMRDRISKALSGPGNFYYGKKRDESFCEQVRRAIVLLRDGEITHRFKSIKEAALNLGVFPPTLHRSLKNKKPISKGRLAGYMAIYAADLTPQSPHGIRQSTQNSSFAVTGDHNLKD